MSQTATRVYLGKKDAFPGWWVVGGCFTVLFFSSALGFYGMSVYLNAFSKELGWKISSLSIATTFFFLVGGITNMLVARLIAKFDVRILIYIGAVVGAGSLYMLGHVSEKWHLFVVYGVFAVAWSCSGLTTATTVVTRWFHTKRAPGIAAASSGLSMGGVVLTPIIKKLIDAKQMSGASPYLALIWFVGMCVPAYLLIRPDPLALNWMPDGLPKPENHISELPGVSLADAVRTKFFWVVTIGYVLVMGSQVGAIQQIVKLVEERTSPGTAALATSVLSGASVVFRLLGGRIIPKFPLAKFMVFIAVMQGIAIILIGQMESTIPLMLAIGLFGAMVGNVLMMQSLLIAERFGVKDYPRISARSGLVSLSGTAIGPILIGTIRDSSGGYTVPYLVAGCLSLVGALIFTTSGPAEVTD
ncbi:MAG: MFS transporter [Ilumatobacteraceae bacterium]|nr:MFS transporter [Ilumatobacteraceae bacterium]